ncbi:hypothetical protein PanWU01x14_029460 [Parasponia andersonii]|uniref:Uncharacterized protein n=1 Tax=Parasponia andersonii TaxID=3476 RepID=A0A2P5DVN3_PARAD|nr:hypothetical protein PanWU01x14_029460 [Parasponia andersonii]
MASDVSQSGEGLGLGQVIKEVEDGWVFVEEEGNNVVEVELLGEFGEELEGEDGVSRISEDEVLDGDKVSGIGEAEVLVLGNFG